MDKGHQGHPVLNEELRSRVLEKVSPSIQEKGMISRATGDLISMVKEVISSNGYIDLEPMLAGSVAKGTMTRDPDIDLFLLFPCSIEEEEMEKVGLNIGREVLDGPKKKYTQHPYLTGTFRGFNCDIVPCYSIPKGSKVISAVDRTPHHTEYINSRLKENQREDVLLLKSFLKGIGSYGAEDTVQGFSGYLVELLVLKYGSFDGVIHVLSKYCEGRKVPLRSEEVQDMQMEGPIFPMVLFTEDELKDQEPMDSKDYLTMFKDDPVIIVDPVDPRRNVAAPLSQQTMKLTCQRARALIDGPKEDHFHPFSRRPISVSGKITKVPSSHDLFSISLPKGDPGIVVTQLRRSLRKLNGILLRNGFDVVHILSILQFPSGSEIDQGYLRCRYVWSGRIKTPKVIFSVTTEPHKLPAEFKHWGPPVSNKRIKDFSEKYGHEVKVDEVSTRAYVMLKREETDPMTITMEAWKGIGHGSRFLGKQLITHSDGDLEVEIIEELTVVK